LGPTTSLDAQGNKEVSCFYRESNHPAPSLVTIATTQTERAVYSKNSAEHKKEDSDEKEKGIRAKVKWKRKNK